MDRIELNGAGRTVAVKTWSIGLDFAALTSVRDGDLRMRARISRAIGAARSTLHNMRHGRTRSNNVVAWHQAMILGERHNGDDTEEGCRHEEFFHNSLLALTSGRIRTLNRSIIIYCRLPSVAQPAMSTLQNVKRRPNGFTLIEVLVTIGVTLVLLGLAVPAFSKARSQALGVRSLSNIRQCGLFVVLYSHDNKGLPPVLFQPELRFMTPAPGNLETITRSGREWKGGWFSSAALWYLAIPGGVPPEVLLEGDVTNLTVSNGAGRVALRTHHRLAETYYGTPRYWNRDTQSAPEGFLAQRIGAESFPSRKGMIFQTRRFDLPGAAEAGGFWTCCDSKIDSSVLWADTSASRVVQSELLPGIENAYHHGLFAPAPYWAAGRPIDNTKNGVEGFDKP